MRTKCRALQLMEDYRSMISHGKEIAVFTGNSNPALAKDICSSLFINPGNCSISQFADGECSVSVYEPVRGKDVFIVQSTYIIRFLLQMQFQHLQVTFSF